MDHNPDRICVWPGYFDAKTSRRSGRRVPRDSSVIKPDLEGLFYAARKVGLRKIMREEDVSHPNRPYGKEGRLWVSSSGAKQSIGASNKEEVLQMIGAEWRQMQKDAKQNEAQRVAEGPKAGDKRGRSQRKSRGQGNQQSQRSSFKKRSGFKKR
jgi:signal recognition particle subunit SEC65